VWLETGFSHFGHEIIAIDPSFCRRYSHTAIFQT